MNAIRDWLCIGRYRETLDPELLGAHGIGAMLQLAERAGQPGIESQFLPVEDGVPLPGHLLVRGVEFVQNQKRLGRKVLVACGAGRSRAVAFVAATLITEEGLSLLQALQTVKNHHPETMLHPSLWNSLCSFYGEHLPFRNALRVMASQK
jgi:protein-tyrosine phosphatase